MSPSSGEKGRVGYFAISSLLLLFFLFFFTAPPVAAQKKGVKGIRFWTSPGYTRVVVDLSGPVEFSKNRLFNPDRLFFDLKHSVISKEVKKSLHVGNGMLKAVRAGQFNSDTVRVVLDLEEVSDFNAFILDDPSRLVIDVYGKGEVRKPEEPAVKRRIVIDPGHGGHDPGAIGPKKLREKDVVLDIALKLKKILSEDPMNEVSLTRERDVYLSLEERTAIANSRNADLFVSIHANASPKRAARGIETYLLNWTNDEEAMRVAARENKISLKRMKEMQKQLDVLEFIKGDLMRANKRNESIKLAHHVQRALVSNLDIYSDRNVIDLGVKQALFYVLLGATMPSVLVEVSFISNPIEEKLLSRTSYRMQIAEAIAAGLNKYMTSAPSGQKVAGL